MHNVHVSLVAETLVTNSADAHDTELKTPALRARVSPLIQVTWIVLALLILGAGLAPWSGWHDQGLSPWAFVAAPLPRHLTSFDLAINVLAFIPLGALGVLALGAHRRHRAVVLLSTSAALLLSAMIESVQTYLPARIPSNIDVLTNTLGALLGALLIAPWRKTLVDRGRLVRWRRQWFVSAATAPLLMVALWPLAQVFPTAMLFAQGEMRDAFGSVAAQLDLPWPVIAPEIFGPAEFVLAEAVVVSASLFAAGLTATALMRKAAPRWLLLGALIAIALLTRTLAWGVQLGPEYATKWLTPGAAGGLLLGGLALTVAALGPARLLLPAAFLSVVVLIAVVNMVPPNPFFSAWIGAWRPGRLQHLATVAQGLSVAWPYLLMLALGLQWIRGPHKDAETIRIESAHAD